MPQQRNKSETLKWFRGCNLCRNLVKSRNCTRNIQDNHGNATAISWTPSRTRHVFLKESTKRRRRQCQQAVELFLEIQLCSERKPLKRITSQYPRAVHAGNGRRRSACTPPGPRTA